MRITHPHDVSMKVIVLGLYLCFSPSGAMGKGTGVDYYTSQYGMQQLARAERAIAEAVSNYIAACERRLEVAKRFLSDYEESGIAFNASELVPKFDSELSTPSSELIIDSANMALPVTAHPLRAYRLLRRYVKDLPALEKELRSDEERKFFKLTERVKAKLAFPTQNDMKGAAEGIIRVHDTYNINIDEFTSGNFYGLNTNTSMNAADCFFIGLYALQSTILTRAIEWLERAYYLVTHKGDSSVSQKEVRGKLEIAVTQHNEALNIRSGNPYLFTKPVKLHEALEEDRGRVRQRLLESDEQPLRNKLDLTNFASLCAGKQHLSNAEISRLKCWYSKTAPLTILDPIKVERHNWEPPVLQLYDMLSSKTIEQIIEAAKETMRRSQVYGKSHEESNMISSSRTSTSTWLRDNDKSAMHKLQGVYRRLEYFTGLKILDRDAAEELQVSCYGIAGHFNPHLDTIFNSIDKRKLDKEEVMKGDRLATVMFYLTNVAHGGNTAFSRLGLSVKPVKGSAIFWYNMDDQDKPDQLSLHGGCPILYGNKCVANKWIRVNAQWRECSKA